jgi:hypothetical protein
MLCTTRLHSISPPQSLVKSLPCPISAAAFTINLAHETCDMLLKEFDRNAQIERVTQDEVSRLRRQFGKSLPEDPKDALHKLGFCSVLWVAHSSG